MKRRKPWGCALWTGRVVLGIAMLAMLAGCGFDGGSKGSDGPAPGSAGNPIVLNAVNDTGSVNGTVGTGFEYYRIDGLSQGPVWLSLTGMTDDGNITVYTTDFATGTVGCSSANAGAADEGCLQQAPPTSLWVRVDGSGTTAGTAFTLAVDPAPAGSLHNPHVVYGQAGAILSYPGTVGTGFTYYEVVVNGAYTDFLVTLEALSDNADLFVYLDAFNGTLGCSSASAGTSIETCSLAPQAKFWIVVDGSGTTAGATFTLNVMGLVL